MRTPRSPAKQRRCMAWLEARFQPSSGRHKNKDTVQDRDTDSVSLASLPSTHRPTGSATAQRAPTAHARLCPQEVAIRLAHSKDHAPYRAPAGRSARHTPRNRQFKIATLHANRDYRDPPREVSGSRGRENYYSLIVLSAAASRSGVRIFYQAIACLGKVLFLPIKPPKYGPIAYRRRDCSGPFFG